MSYEFALNELRAFDFSKAFLLNPHDYQKAVSHKSDFLDALTANGFIALSDSNVARGEFYFDCKRYAYSDLLQVLEAGK